MYQYTIIQWLFFFYFYCFFGWCFESSYVSLKQRRPVNRGFMHGPFLPIYGSGAIMMLVVSAPFQANLFFVYLAGCVGATVLEYVTGVAMEALFKVRYWDYSNQPFNYKGHICLSSTLAWGGLTILMTRVVHKPVERFVLSLPEQGVTIVTLVLTVIICCDFTLSFKEAMDLRDILIKMEKAKQDMYRMQRRLDVMIAFASQDLSERKDAIVQRSEELAEEWQQRGGELGEELLQKGESIVNGFQNRREEITGEWSKWKEECREEWQQYKDQTADHVSLRLDELRGNIEERLDRLKALTESKQDRELKGELEELQNSYGQRMGERASLRERYSERIGRLLRSNPTMSSGRFKDFLEEVKEKISDRRNQS